MKKVYIWATLLPCLAAAVLGLVMRQSYTNFTAEPDPMQHFNVALMKSDTATSAVEFEREILPESIAVVRVKATGRVNYLFRTYTETVTVQEVFKGEGIRPGEQIDVEREAAMIFFETMSVNMGFVNYMQKDKEYLLFLGRKVDTLDKKETVYRLTEGIWAPIFAYDDIESVVKTPDEHNYVPYREVAGSEFFVSTPEALAELRAFKQEVLAQYPRP